MQPYSHRDLVLHLLIRLFADPADVLDLLDAPETAVGLTILDEDRKSVV